MEPVKEENVPLEMEKDALEAFNHAKVSSLAKTDEAEGKQISRQSSKSWDDLAKSNPSQLDDSKTQVAPSVVSTATDDESRSTQVPFKNSSSSSSIKGTNHNHAFKSAVNSFLKFRKTSSAGDYDVETGLPTRPVPNHPTFWRTTVKHEGESLFMNNPRSFRELDIERLRRRGFEQLPMSYWNRIMAHIRNRMPSVVEDDSVTNQIRMPPHDEPGGILHGMFHICHLRFHDLIVWQINTSYFNFFLFVLIWYLIWVNLFALLIYGTIAAGYASSGGKECITTFEFEPDEPSSDFHQNMEFAFELSWTTFSTVGYGAISPSGGNAGCYWIRYICAIEAFVGVIYFGFSGAIFFAHITRILSRAPVTFSSCVCIQYSSSASGRSDFPVLEFRLVNNKANVSGWDILDANLKCMVSIDEPATEPDVTQDTVRESSELWAIEVGKDSGLTNAVPVSKHAFHKIDIQADSHPYFRRVWYCRHILNDQSPLLRREVRHRIRHNGNKWPSDLNDFESVRHSLVKFNAMITTMTGTLNTTSNTVFREKRYQFEDLCVGYKFAGLLYLSKPRKLFKSKKSEEGGSRNDGGGDGRVKVDMRLIHDITPQDGGGEEPLDAETINRLLNRSRSGRRLNKGMWDD